jgi:hypothetical protein
MHTTSVGNEISSWLHVYPRALGQYDALEIGSFLTNFDDSDFTWTIPLGNIDEAFSGTGGYASQNDGRDTM